MTTEAWWLHASLFMYVTAIHNNRLRLSLKQFTEIVPSVVQDIWSELQPKFENKI